VSLNNVESNGYILNLEFPSYKPMLELD